MSTASVPPPGWVEPQRPTAPSSFSSPERPAGTDFATQIATEDKRRLDTKRVKARIIDAILCAPAYVVARHQWGDAGGWAVYQLVQLVLAHVCEVTVGQTPGKHLMKLRVARKDDGGLPTPRQAAARGVIGIVEWGLIGLIALHVSKGRTRLGDRAAGTVVVDVARHPAPSRGLTAGTFAYPLLWAIPVVLVCLGAARERAGVTYRQQADAVCGTINGQLRTSIQSDGPYALQRAYAQEYATLNGMHAPAGWRDRHAALVARVGDLSTFSDAIVQAVEASKHPQQTWLAYDDELGSRLDAASAAAHAAGYRECAA